MQGAEAVVLALRFTVLKSVIDEIADPLTDKVVVVPSNPVTLDAEGHISRVLAAGQSSGEVVAGWLGAGRAWPWRSERCRPISSSPPAAGHRTGRSSSTRPTTIVPARESSG